MSDDLHHWTRVSDGPSVRVDGRWYKNLANTPAPTEGPDLEGSSETWRDPLVFADPDGRGWHLLLSARARGAARTDDGDLYHLFFLQAPRALGDPGKRHTAARVGHATSRDLVTWDYLGETFGPAESGFDDLAIWTGSVLHDGARWRMFYTDV